MSINETIAALYTAHGARLYRYAAMLLADRAAAEDATHDTFVQLARALRRAPDARVSFGYLAVTLRNTKPTIDPVRAQEVAFVTEVLGGDENAAAYAESVVPQSRKHDLQTTLPLLEELWQEN